MEKPVQYADGKSSRIRECTVHLSSAALKISDRNNPSQYYLWTCAKLRLIDPWEKEKPAVYAHDAFPDARLYVADESLAKAIIKLIRDKTRSSSVVIHGHWRFLFALGLICVVLVGVSYALIHKASSYIAPYIPVSWEKDIFASILENMKANNQLCDSKTAQNGLDRIVNSLVKAGKASERPAVFILKDSYPNAYAFPGPGIMVSTGFLRMAHNENEIIGVLGHELGHIVNRDYMQGLTEAIGYELYVGMIFGGNATLTKFTKAAGVLQGLRFSRQQELEADLWGASVLAKNGFDPEMQFNFLTRIDAVMQQRASVPGNKDLSYYLHTHPATAERLLAVQREKKKYHNVPPAKPMLTRAELESLVQACATESDKNGRAGVSR